MSPISTELIPQVSNSRFRPTHVDALSRALVFFLRLLVGLDNGLY